MIDRILVVWFILTGLSVLFIAWDLLYRTPEMKVMKLGWILVALYTGPVALVVYWLSCREPSPGTHEAFIAPLWKQTVGSTIHCMAGDATGVIVSAILVNRMRLPMAGDAAVEYVAGFAFGLFIFQALFMRGMLGGSYAKAVRASFLPEWLSMNAVMAGMVPVMTILMSRDMKAMHATSLRFWGVMSLATLAGAVLAMPVNYWLVAKKLKHGMGTERALGKGGAPVSAGNASRQAAPASMAEDAPSSGGAMSRPMPMPVGGAMSEPMAMPVGGAMSEPMAMSGDHAMAQPTVSFGPKVVVSLLTVAMLAAGVFVAARAGGFASAPMKEMQMDQMPGGEMPMR